MRNRKKSLLRQGQVLVLAATAAATYDLSFWNVSSCHGFEPSLSVGLGRWQRSSSSSTKMELVRFYVQEVDVPDVDVDDPKSHWLRWMMGGKPRGTNRVILREAEELGGVPRSARYSSRDWLHSFVTLPNSDILRDIKGPVRTITLWATFLSIFHQVLLVYKPSWCHRMYLPSSAPHSLMMSALALLLVFRTNSAYQRFAEGRKIWETIINTARDLYRMMMLYEKQIGLDKRRRLQKLLAAFPYLLRHRIRPNLVMKRLDDDQFERDPENTILLYQDQGPKDDDEEAAAVARTEEETGQSRRKTRPLFWVDKRTLPWRLLPTADGALEKCARAQNRPLWVCDRMAAEFRAVPDQNGEFTNRERLILISHVDKLSRCIGGAERIHQTVVPLNYARHTLRALTMWLFSLPLVLLKDLKLLTGPVLLVMSWMLFGVFEVSCAIEDPFQGTLRLSILCDTIRRDVLGDENIRSTAFRLELEERPAASALPPVVVIATPPVAPPVSIRSAAAETERTTTTTTLEPSSPSSLLPPVATILKNGQTPSNDLTATSPAASLGSSFE